MNYSVDKGTESLINLIKAVLLLITTVIGIFLTCCNQKSDVMLGYKNVNIIPLTSEIVIENQTVLAAV